MPVTKNNLTATDLLVMEHLTHSTTTPSAVSLAADIWQPDDTALGADPVGFVQWVLDNLNAHGLVVFRMKEARHNKFMLVGELQGFSPYENFAYQIRLTREGWDLMGYRTRAVQVNSRMSTAVHLSHTGDRTNFRKHGDTAEGGAITTETFQEHRVNYPHHLHPLMNDGDEDMANVGTRQYRKVTAELEAEVLAYHLRHPTDSYRDLAEVLGYPERTIRYVLTDLPRLRRANNGELADASLKQRVIWALEIMDFEHVKALRDALGNADDAHNIVHILHSLHKEGKVDFIEKGAEKQPIRIRMTRRGQSEAERASTKVNGTVPLDSQPVEERRTDYTVGDLATAAPTENSETETPSVYVYPLLTALLQRERRREQGDAKALQYIQAAELLRQTDPETAALLDSKAAENDIPYPSPLEAEYIRYVEEHEGSPVPDDE